MSPYGAYHADEHGQPDFSRPMTPTEILSTYWDSADYYPHTLAEFYLNFHNFRQVEFLVFEQRLSAAILVANSARDGISELRTDLQNRRAEMPGFVSGWEGETDMAHDESLEVARLAEQLAVGSVIVTATAALEALVADLMGHDLKAHDGLAKSLRELLKQRGTGRAQAKRIDSRMRSVTHRRNTFAHELTGSMWSEGGKAAASFDSKALHDTLFEIAYIAIELEGVMSDAGSE